MENESKHSEYKEEKFGLDLSWSPKKTNLNHYKMWPENGYKIDGDIFSNCYISSWILWILFKGLWNTFQFPTDP